MSTYPNEAWPSDVEIEALDGTLDAATGLPYIPKGTGPLSSPSYEVQYNRRLQRLNRIVAGWRQGMVVEEGSLLIGVYPVEYTQGGSRRSFAGATAVSVDDDSTSMIYLDSSAQLQVASTWPTDVTTFLPLAEVEAADGVLTITDRRTWAAFHVPSMESNTVRDRRVVSVSVASVGSNQSGAEIYKFDPAENLTLEEVQVYCTASAATASVDVREAGVSMLSAPATPSAGNVVKPTVSDAALASTNLLTVNVTTDGTGTISNLTVTMLFKAMPTA